MLPIIKMHTSTEQANLTNDASNAFLLFIACYFYLVSPNWWTNANPSF